MVPEIIPDRAGLRIRKLGKAGHSGEKTLSRVKFLAMLRLQKAFGLIGVD